MSIPPLTLPTDDAMSRAALWLADVVTGSAAIGIATIAVASVGFMMLTGRTDIRRGANVIVGCFILLGAPGIASAFMLWANGGRAPVVQAELAAPLPTTPPAPSPQNNDPYAGASLIR